MHTYCMCKMYVRRGKNRKMRIRVYATTQFSESISMQEPRFALTLMAFIQHLNKMIIGMKIKAIFEKQVINPFMQSY